MSDTETRTSSWMQEAPPTSDEAELVDQDAAIIAVMSKFFVMLDRMITVLRVYPKRHPIVDSVARQCVGRLKDLPRDVDAITVEVTPSAVISRNGNVIFSKDMSESGRFIWYRPHSDGVRYLTFERELDSNEIQELMSVVSLVDGGLISSDDDVVTLLWEKNLRTITYEAVEGFVDAEVVNDVKEVTDDEVLTLITNAAVEPDGEAKEKLDSAFKFVGLRGLDWFTSERVRSIFDQQIEMFDDDDLAFALGIEKETIDNLYREWQENSQLEFRFIEALLSIIRADPDSDAGVRARQAVARITTELFDREYYEEACQVLELLHRRRDMFTEDVDPLGEVFAAVSEPERIDALCWCVINSHEEREVVARLLQLLVPDQVQARLLVLLGGKEIEDEVSNLLVDLLVRVTNEHNAANAWTSQLLQNKAYLARIMGYFGSAQRAHWAPLVPIVSAVLDRGDEAMKRTALDLDLPVWQELRVAKQRLVELTDSDDPKIRNRVYDLLTRHHPDLLQECLRELVESGKLGSRSLSEIRFLFRKYVQANYDNVAALRPYVDVAGLFGEASRRRALAAAQVLLEFGDEKGVEIIRRRANKTFTSGKLKDGYRRLLEGTGYSEVSEMSEG